MPALKSSVAAPPRPSRATGAVVAAAVVVVALCALAIGPALGVALETVALVAAGLLLLAAVVAAVGWRRDRERAERAAGAAAAQRDVREADRERHATERAQLEQRMARAEETLRQERVMLRRMRESVKAEREWSRELREQLAAAHARHRRPPQLTDVRELILNAAIQLVGAEKGLMLAHADDDDDGDLDLVAAFGFKADPEHSAVVQRFAREVLELDEIVRDDDPGRSVGPFGPADEEIDQLVAIPLFLRDHFDGVIICVNRPGGFEEVGDELLLALGDHAGAALQQGRLRNEVREAQRGTVRALAEATAAWDPLVHRESGRLAVLAGRLGTALGFDERETDVLVCATVLRAIGHLPLPEQPLRKLGRLTREERAVVEMHPRLAFNMLAQAPGLRDVAVALLYHHERVDGGGYPAGLAGDNVPVSARALHVLEAYGAMTHERPYRAAQSRDDACAELRSNAGSQFDERVVRAFLAVVGEREPETEDAVAETLLDVLPFDPADEDGGALTRLAASAVDGQTLLGNHRALLDAAREATRERATGRGFAVAMAQVQGLAEVNARDGYLAGDRVVQIAARAALRAAARVGGTAFRDSGRRFSILAPLDRDEQLHDLLHEVQTEFAGGPAVRVVASPWEPGESGEDVVTRAREALLAGPDAG